MIQHKKNLGPMRLPLGESPYFIGEMKRIAKTAGKEKVKARVGNIMGKFFSLRKKRVRDLIIEVNIADQGKHMPVSLFEKAIKELKKYGFRTVFFMGGEPILHPKFDKLVKTTLDTGYYYSLKIKDESLYLKYWEIIKKYHPTPLVDLDLEGHNTRTHDDIKQKEGSFKKTIEAIGFFNKNRIPVAATMHLNKKNQGQIKEVFSLCQSMGIRILRYSAFLKKEEKHFLSEKERKKCIKTITGIKGKFGFMRMFINPELSGDNPKGVDFCRTLRIIQQPAINYDGEMLFCGRIYKKAKSGPNIVKDGLVNAFCRNIDIVAEIKKQRTKDLSCGTRFDGFDTCEYCNKYIEKIIKKNAKA